MNGKGWLLLILALIAGGAVVGNGHGAGTSYQDTLNVGTVHCDSSGPASVEADGVTYTFDCPFPGEFHPDRSELH